VSESSTLDWSHGETVRTNSLKSRLIQGEGIFEVQPPRPLIEGYLNIDSLACIFGPPKSFKTFVAIDIAMSIANGRHWIDEHSVHGGPVVYIAAEGVAGLSKRVQAWMAAHEGADLSRVSWIAGSVDLFGGSVIDRDRGTDEMCEILAELKPVLVVVDTLARCALGAEENSSRDMGHVVANLDRLRRSCGACVLAVHHSGKDRNAGMRGSSALLGAVDTALQVRRSGDDRVSVSTTAQKDMEEAPDVPLRLVSRSGSLYVVAADVVPSEAQENRAERDGAALAALDGIDDGPGVGNAEWKAAFVEASGLSPSTFNRARKSLVESGSVLHEGTRYRAASDAAGGVEA